MPLVDNIKWDEITEITSSAVSGLDGQAALASRLEKEDRNYTYGFCGKSYLPEWMADHWKHLTVDHFGAKSVKAFNDSTALRMNVTVNPDGNKLMYREEFVMYKPRSLAEAQQKYREDFAERTHSIRKQETSQNIERPYSTETPGIDSALEEKQMPASKFAGG